MSTYTLTARTVQPTGFGGFTVYTGEGAPIERRRFVDVTARTGFELRELMVCAAVEYLATHPQSPGCVIGREAIGRRVTGDSKVEFLPCYDRADLADRIATWLGVIAMNNGKTIL